MTHVNGMIDQLPIPEIIAALVISAVALGIRLAWRAIRARVGCRAASPAEQAPIRREPEQTRARLVASCVLFVVISVPLTLRLVPPNGMYGFRTGVTRSTPAIWYQANAFMGWALSIAAVVSATLVIVLPATAKRWTVWAVFYGPLAVAIAFSFAYLRRL